MQHDYAVFCDGHIEPICWHQTLYEGSIVFATKSGVYFRRAEKNDNAIFGLDKVEFYKIKFLARGDINMQKCPELASVELDAEDRQLRVTIGQVSLDFKLCLGKNATNETASKILSKMITAEIVGGDR